MKKVFGIVYFLWCSNAAYVGATERPEQRRREQLSALENQRHFNEALQAAANECGVGAIQYVPAIVCHSHQSLQAAEQYLIDLLRAIGVGVFNADRRVPKNAGGYKLSEETKRRQSLAKTGDRHPDNRKNYAFCSPSGEVIEVRGLKEFCAQHNLSRSQMSRLASGKISSHRGWTSGTAAAI